MKEPDIDAYKQIHSRMQPPENFPVQIKKYLSGFKQLSIDEQNTNLFNNRVDIKYVLPTNALENILGFMRQHYSILSIKGNCIQTYENTYFDTENYDFYLAHHNDKLNRRKLRIRSYRETGLSFIETKFKSNKKRTLKKRIPIENYSSHHLDTSLDNTFSISIDSLTARLYNSYHRMTFIHNNKAEKVTIDCNLVFKNEPGDKVSYLKDILIIELKGLDKLQATDFYQFCKQQFYKPEKFSKYCIGTCLVNESETLKKNNFKKTLLSLNTSSMDF
jgi:hypothetical protein